MPDNTQRTQIQIAWINVAKSTQILLVPQIDDRPLDQYLPFRDAVIALVQSEKFLDELEVVWKPFSDQPLTDIGAALLLELEAYPRAVEVAKATEKPEEKGWWKKMLGRASTVSGSVKDIIEKDLPQYPYLKSGLTLFKELIDLFRGKD